MSWDEHVAAIPFDGTQPPGPLVIEARLTWEHDVLRVVHVEPKVRVSLADFGLDLPVDEPIAIATLVDGEPALLSPRGEVAPPGTSIWFRHDRVSLRIALVRRGEILPRPKSDRRIAKGVALGALIHATMFALAILGRASDAELEAASRGAMEGYLAVIDQRATEAMAATSPVVPETPPDHALPADSKPREAGQSGNPARQTPGGLTRTTRGERAHASDPRPAEEVTTFGMVGLIATSGGPGQSAGRSAFADFEGSSAMGSIFGGRIDDAPGFGGATLSGVGEGGGGTGAGVALGGRGTCGPGCYGQSSWFSSHGLSFGTGHEARAPVLRGGDDGCAAQVNGRLPPESVQRIVRQNFGRLRLCYESGLRRDPGLEGRIAVKFVIDCEGAVAMASADERSLPDAEVAACVVRAYQAMTFPKPEGGIVTVVYPVVFGS